MISSAVNCFVLSWKAVMQLYHDAVFVLCFSTVCKLPLHKVHTGNKHTV